MRAVYAMRGGRLWASVGLLALGLNVFLCQVGAALDASGVDVSGLGIDTWAEGGRAHLEVPGQGVVVTGDSNGTGRGMPLGATSGSESVDIPWQELLNAISSSNREYLSALGKVRMDVRSPVLEPLVNLMEDAGGDVCIISR
jgi:hypothetical protein